MQRIARRQDVKNSVSNMLSYVITATYVKKRAKFTSANGMCTIALDTTHAPERKKPLSTCFSITVFNTLATPISTMLKNATERTSKCNNVFHAIVQSTT